MGRVYIELEPLALYTTTLATYITSHSLFTTDGQLQCSLLLKRIEIGNETSYAA